MFRPFPKVAPVSTHSTMMSRPTKPMSLAAQSEPKKLAAQAPPLRYKFGLQRPGRKTGRLPSNSLEQASISTSPLGIDPKIIHQLENAYLSAASDSPQNPIAHEAVEQVTNVLPTLEEISQFMDQAGYDKHYLGAVYRQLDPSVELFDLDPRKTAAFKKAVDQKLAAMEQYTVNDKELFLLQSATNPNEVLERTREEIELDMKIKNHLIEIGKQTPNSEELVIPIRDVVPDQVGWSVPEPAKKVVPAKGNPLHNAPSLTTTSAGPHATYMFNEVQSVPLVFASVPDAQGFSLPTAVGRKELLQYMGDEIDWERFDLDMENANRRVPEPISDASNNCWMRAFWLALFNDSKSHEDIKQRLTDLLSDKKLQQIAPKSIPVAIEEIQVDGKLIFNALANAEHAQDKTARTLEQQIEILCRAAYDWKNRQLRKSDVTSNSLPEDIDNAITVISRALLLKDLEERQLSSSDHNQEAVKKEAIEIINATTGTEMGLSDHIATLGRALGIDTVIITDTGLLQIAPAPGSALDQFVNPIQTHSTTEIPNANDLLAKTLDLNLTVISLKNKHFEPYLHGSGWSK